MRQYNYGKLAEYYDAMELSLGDGYKKTTDLLDEIFKKHRIKTVLDMTCGTGTQTIGLRKKGYRVTGSDISKNMLKYAKRKSMGLGIKYCLGDIRESKFGKFDSVIAIFNAIGHLSKKDFDRAISNVSKNLKSGGLFIFDIFNLDFMRCGGFIKYKFIDVALENDGEKIVRFNKNVLNNNGMMRVSQETFIQPCSSKPKIFREIWDMQIYTSLELRRKLERKGFKVVGLCDLSGKKLNKKKSLSILVVAEKARICHDKM